MDNEIDSHSLDANSDWQLWHSDTFDRNSPLSLQASGTDIIQGLFKLWLYTLREGLLENGSASFSCFHLQLGDTTSTRVDIFVKPFNNLSLMKLREWAKLSPQNQNSEEEPGDEILLKLAQMHYGLLQKGNRWKTSAIDWSVESKEILALVEVMKEAKELMETPSQHSKEK